MDGAVHTTALGTCEAWATTLQQSLITPLPTASITSHAGSYAIVIAPTAASSGSMRSLWRNTNV